MLHRTRLEEKKTQRKRKEAQQVIPWDMGMPPLNIKLGLESW